MKKLIPLITLAALVAAGCQQDSMAPKEKETLKGNLNAPVDVEKIRAEYNKNNPKGGEAPKGPQAATEGM